MNGTPRGDSETQERGTKETAPASTHLPPPLIIGHRGASAFAPENTLAAFERALKDGADGLEFDVQLTRDGVPVVIHDANLRRTALRDGKVSALSADELARIDVGTWFNLHYPQLAHPRFSRERVPTLAQVLKSFAARCHVLYVEMKCRAGETGALASEVVNLVRADAHVERVVVESFALDAIKEIKQLAPEIRTAALFDRKLSRLLPSSRKIIAQALDCGANEIALHHSLVTSHIIQSARRENLNTLAWTVDDPLWMQTERAAGLCAVITNYPARMRAALDAMRA